ncbi:hypothetical protein BZG36_02912 [Bifiguratus adelaidae]|uniref:Major facilitator superfamily (MFS) profile domain-containing protein n=1 Tax=Bifiguratus adelaidae TaxID=1938954 RepID=A0A261Y1B2_9FUNG|nr:hypothetical protein BZG36_02912 [Bifiguratus adelaidae]
MAMAVDLTMPYYLRCVTFVALSGFLFGSDTGSIGPVTQMPFFKTYFGALSPTITGLLVSSILITASCASLISGHVTDQISRIRAIGLGAAIFAVGTALEGASQNLAMFFIGRALAGVGEGFFLNAAMVYAVEVAPRAKRGMASCTVQLLITIGIATGYFVCYGAVHLNSTWSWRLPYMVQTGIAVILASGSQFLPFSPRWLFHVGRDEEGTRNLEKLDPEGAALEKAEIQAAKARLEAFVPEIVPDTSLAIIESQSEAHAFDIRALFEKSVRKRTILGIYMSASQMMSGIDGVLYYAPLLFAQAGLSSTQASFFASGITGLVNVACTVLAQWKLDAWGRRPTYLVGGTSIATTMLLMGILYASGASNTAAGKWVIIVLIYIFVVSFALSWAVVTKLYSTEIQPTRTRSAASSLAQSANWVVNWLVAFTTPLFLARVTWGPYILWGAFSATSVFVAGCMMPETKGRGLEEIDQAFDRAEGTWEAKVLQLWNRVRKREQVS